MLRRIRIPLQVTLVTLILTILLVVTGAMALYNHSKSTQAAIEIADDLLFQVNQTLLTKVDSLFSPIQAIGNRVSELPNLADKPQFTAHPATWFFIQALQSAPQIYSIYMGYADGDFYQIIHILPDDDDRRIQIGAPAGTRFALRRIMDKHDGTKAEIWKFIDSTHRTLGSRVDEHATYDPRTRPWYQRAIHREGLTKTAPYVFTSNRALGLTVARRFDGTIPGVFGVDLTLKSVSSFLASQKIGTHGAAFIFDSRGYLIAHPDPEMTIKVEQAGPETHVLPTTLYDLNNPVITNLYSHFTAEHDNRSTFSFQADGQRYLARISRIDNAVMDDGFIAAFAPQTDFTATMNQVLAESKIFTAILLSIVLPIAFLAARSIAVSLKRLTKEADEIRNFNLNGTTNISSFIAEINLLGDSFATMKSALNTFGRYVPKTLVERIIESDETPTLGGHRRPLTLLFTDIADFTTLSESMAPEELMLQTSDYFETLGSVLIQNNATIDKFIGDAIMAFWNAPRKEGNHVRAACLATLLAAKASNDLNARWEAQGKPIFFTRFGLHTGECIVGNVGSSDRMDYTAMGDAVNIASRLEGLNKYFGTQILVSQSVYDQATSDFIFCPAGRVIPKGAQVALNIYALMGTNPERKLPCPASPDALAFCGEWSEAFSLFQERQFTEAAARFESMIDRFESHALPKHYLILARQYAQSPPEADWQGVEIFSTK